MEYHTYSRPTLDEKTGILQQGTLQQATLQATTSHKVTLSQTGTPTTITATMSVLAHRPSSPREFFARIYGNMAATSTCPPPSLTQKVKEEEKVKVKEEQKEVKEEEEVKVMEEEDVKVKEEKDVKVKEEEEEDVPGGVRAAKAAHSQQPDTVCVVEPTKTSTKKREAESSAEELEMHVPKFRPLTDFAVRVPSRLTQMRPILPVPIFRMSSGPFANFRPGMYSPPLRDLFPFASLGDPTPSSRGDPTPSSRGDPTPSKSLPSLFRPAVSHPSPTLMKPMAMPEPVRFPAAFTQFRGSTQYTYGPVCVRVSHLSTVAQRKTTEVPDIKQEF